ncbi:MAG: hypothetical protein AAFV51_13900, partial [Pseudomonadota bacterium]
VHLTIGPTMTEITPDIIADHGLKPEEYDLIVQRLNREPNLLELGIFSVIGDDFGGDFGHGRSDCEMNVIPETAQPLSGTQCVRVRSLHPWVPALAALGRDDGKGVWRQGTVLTTPRH